MCVSTAIVGSPNAIAAGLTAPFRKMQRLMVGLAPMMAIPDPPFTTFEEST